VLDVNDAERGWLTGLHGARRNPERADRDAPPPSAMWPTGSNGPRTRSRRPTSQAVQAPRNWRHRIRCVLPASDTRARWWGSPIRGDQVSDLRIDHQQTARCTANDDASPHRMEFTLLELLVSARASRSEPRRDPQRGLGLYPGAYGGHRVVMSTSPGCAQLERTIPHPSDPQPGATVICSAQSWNPLVSEGSLIPIPGTGVEASRAIRRLVIWYRRQRLP